MSHRFCRRTVVTTLLLCAVGGLASGARAAETQRFYLSGKGKDDAVPWDFMCTLKSGTPASGSTMQNAGTWSTIKVPSNWELQGFGVYTYGRDNYPRNGWPTVTGHYKRTFTLPAGRGWDGSRVFIVFDGAMTDTSVMVNGKSAGAMHQGGYFQFKYDITSLLKPGENLLEVTVDDESANASVNNAERRGDYWNYAGIFRPVYLEGVPATSIERVAIDAKADGKLTADLVIEDTVLRSQDRPIIWTVESQILDMDGKPVGAKGTQSFQIMEKKAHVEQSLTNAKLWNAETPNLYQLELTLKDATGAPIHTVRQKFGFRTIEARAGAGLFVNGQRIMLKGADRHSFWPDSGRCLSEELSRADINLMKDANMNAVRMSHYPPDIHFLDACDEMGMYVLDELPGWHAKYDTDIGHKLVGEMITRDVNHPSILFWDNGNEGGWNTGLDDDFAQWDPQKRNVLHPWELFRGIDTKHYPDFTTLSQKAAGPNVFFPTEMLHGLYDGGAGAGLEDFWNVMMESKVSAGGIIWVLADEDVKRTDLGGKIDSHGNMAPDGIVGPYREKEGSFFTIKQLWSPIALSPVAGNTDAFTLENRYSFTDARDCTFNWEWRRFKDPGTPGDGYLVTLKGSAAPEKATPPGTTGRLLLQMPQMSKTPPHDALAITAKDPGGRELWTWVFPTEDVDRIRKLAARTFNGDVAAADKAYLVATAGDLVVTFDKTTGAIKMVTRGGKPFSISGPRFVDQPSAAAARGAATREAAPAPRLRSLKSATDPATHDLVVTAEYTGALASLTYRVHPNGWITVDFVDSLTGDYDYFGMGFDYPEANVKGMSYLGNGPYHVWKNRPSGGMLNVWDKPYNNTVVGDPTDLAAGAKFDYPEFKGYYSGVRWVQVNTSEGPITAVINQDNLFLQMFTPRFPPAANQGQTGVTFPKTGISFLHAIPPIGSKFVGPRASGPMGQPNTAQGEYRGSVSLYFGDVPR